MARLDLDRYPQDLKAIAPSFYTLVDGCRVQRAGATEVVEIDVQGGGQAVTLLLELGGLYLKGFRNRHGTFVFEGKTGGTMLRFGCSYVGSGTLGIFNDSLDNGDALNRRRTKQNIVESLRTLAAFQGGNDLDLKVPLATMAFITSEALRFTIVYDRIVETCKGMGGTFSFAELRPFVQDWAKLSQAPSAAGLLLNKVFIAHGRPGTG